MRIARLLLVAVALPAGAQTILRVPGSAMSPSIIRGFGGEQPRVAIGVTTTSSATVRDTLGVLVTAVAPDSPAEKAGIAEGDRIASVNGVSLQLAATDVDEWEMAGAMSRRLTRELDKLKVGDDVELRVHSGGKAKTVRLKTVAPDDLYESFARRSATDRATLGISIGTTGSSRDTLGVFVMSVDDGGPAAKAGIEEGARIASINGVDLRGPRPNDDEFVLRATNVNRLERELGRARPGDEVELRVYYNGQFKNVKVRTIAASERPRRNRSITIMGDGGSGIPPIAPLLDGIRTEVGRSLGSGMGRAMTLPRIGNRVVW
jgi:S1-C subfamily serine protease